MIKKKGFNMWLTYAFLSALFAGLTSILAKCGIQKMSSTFATALRTIVVFFFSWIMVFVVGSQNTLSDLTLTSLFFIILSGLSTGASWLCYFKAIQLGPINKVVPIDKLSTVLTIILALILLKEPLSFYKLIGMILIVFGTLMMIQKQHEEEKEIDRKWLIYALLSAVFASLTAILAKVGMTNVDSYVGTAIRTGVVIIMAWFVVFVSHQQNQWQMMDRKELCFIILSGFATGVSWLCYFRALQLGPASVIVPIDKLSIVVSVVFSYFVFHEKLSLKALIGLMILVVGTLVMLK